MRVGIDISSITDNRAGVGTYTYALLRHLVAIAPDCVFKGFSSGRARVNLGPLAGRVSHRRFPLFTRATYALWNYLHWPLVDTFLGGVDVFHATNYFLPPTHRAKRVVTFHDLAVLRMPERCSPRIAGTFARGVRRFAREADAVLACSEATRQDTIELLDVAPEKVTVTYEGVDEDFLPVERGEAAREVARAYGVREPYVLFVSTLEPRKNVPALLRAFARIAPSVPHRLVLAGGMGWKTDAIHTAIREVALGDRLVLTDFVPTRRMLACLYSAADLFAFPTWHEGFGLPVLEAMTCGCPVVASDNSSIPEVVGDAGLLCPADDIEGLAGNILRVIEDSSLSNELADKGRARARLFSWDACARKTLDVYRSVIL